MHEEDSGRKRMASHTMSVEVGDRGKTNKGLTMDAAALIPGLQSRVAKNILNNDHHPIHLLYFFTTEKGPQILS